MTKISKLKVGELLPEIKLSPVSRLDLIKYAGASGDYNPIHTIDEEAKKAGLPGIIAHGMWTMGNLAKLFTPYYEEGFIRDYFVRFQSMVFLDDVITLKATVKEKEEKKLRFAVSAVNQNGKEVAKGEAIFSVY
ncbi:MaoC family dehydratase [Parageobacillus thermoglucosidasius]|uniref:MaoC domain protein dehydratase n=1 Tax=Geobacillus sp. (strain Y4.1MC1) TaxID=581103 RepID=A0A7U3YEY6_GEOS0|nr:MaoC family dehydratase [Parageobacillus thermoglucosidasius]MED4903525.1 MaoC family dehydratase [Parageobacillus thermoglucosidasius]MED4912766.1 MaoC family dehydratase [Parageobacillus thermoglucosidasius]MED4945156.1 MaoC family dehydratase [Parageobacillus thermoglucosidasius]MED4982265.1 MaoC family dehydratase [Parageobacillus thermoglucosidasius]